METASLSLDNWSKMRSWYIQKSHFLDCQLSKELSEKVLCERALVSIEKFEFGWMIQIKFNFKTEN